MSHVSHPAPKPTVDVADEVPDTPEQVARDKILSAADRCFRRYGVAKTTIDDIAEVAGLSRATIYRYIDGGRDEIVMTVLLTEGRRLIEPIVERARQLDGFREQLTAIGTEVVAATRGDDYLSMLFSPEWIGIGASRADHATTTIDQALWILQPILDDARATGELRADVTDREVAEWITRHVLSLLTFAGEGGTSPESTERIMREFVVPPLLRHRD